MFLCVNHDDGCGHARAYWEGERNKALRKRNNKVKLEKRRTLDVPYKSRNRRRGRLVFISHFPLSLAYKGIGVVWGYRKRVSKSKDPQRSAQKQAAIWTARYSRIVSGGRLQSPAQIAHKYTVCSAYLPRAFGLCRFQNFLERSELVFGTGYCVIRAICSPKGEDVCCYLQ